MDRTTHAAFEAVQRGYQVIPIAPRDKKPIGANWPSTRWPVETTQADVDRVFAEAGANMDLSQGGLNLGVLCGEPSGNLIDIDLDHPNTNRLKDHFLPPTPARGGRAQKPSSHYWYLAKPGTLQSTRQFLMPRENGKRGAVIVEYRGTGAQTVIPPSVHPSGEQYRWGLEPWGGQRGPTLVDGRVLLVQTALLALASVLIDKWPKQGSRHEAYLALAGGLLRYGDQVHPYWEQNAAALIGPLAEATLDDDGPAQRISESIGTTIAALKAGKPATGFPHLAQILGDATVDQVRSLVGDIEQASGWTSRQAPAVLAPASQTSPQAADAALRLQQAQSDRDAQRSTTSVEDRDPLDERLGSWEPLDLEPYLTGKVTPVSPAVLEREDGCYLMYPGRVNMLYGSSETAKSWIALRVGIQEMEKGNRVLFLDFEDEPVNTLSRLTLMGATHDMLRMHFSYIRPEEPLAPMQRNKWGNDITTEVGRRNWEIFQNAVEKTDPTLIVADGMTSLYGLHGQDTNDSSSTDIITGWLKGLTRNGRSTVIIIDHTGKGSERGTLPIGSQHKQAMVQGTLLQAWMIQQPMPGKLGEIELILIKDRPGQVRTVSADSTGGGKIQSAARVVIDSTQPGQTDILIKRPTTIAQQMAGGVLDLRQSKDAERAQRAALDKQANRDKALSAFGGEYGKTLSKLEILTAIGVAPAGTTAVTRLPKGVQDYWQVILAELSDPAAPAGQWLEMRGDTKNRTYTLVLGAGDDD